MQQITLCFLISSLFPTYSLAQDQLVLENSGKDGKPNHDADIFIKSPMIRFEQAKRSMIFNADTKTVYSLDHKRKQYLELDKEQMKSMTSTVASVSGVVEQLKKQLEKLPPEQRAKWEEKLNKNPFSGTEQAQKNYIYTEIKSGIPCGKWTCKLIEGSKDGVKTSEIHLADYAALALESDSIKALKSMGQYFSEMAQMVGAHGPQFKFDKFEGIPVLIKTFDKDGLRRTISISEAKKFTPKKETFSIPKEYEKSKIPLL